MVHYGSLIMSIDGTLWYPYHTFISLFVRPIRGHDVASGGPIFYYDP
jgi:hypothetical protein